MTTDQSQVYYRFSDEMEYRLDENFNNPIFDELKIILEKAKFDVVSIGDPRIKQLITSGKTPKNLQQSKDFEIPFIGGTSIYDEKVDLTIAPRIKREIHETKLKSSQIKKGDILITMAGVGIGRCAVFETDDECNANQALAILRINEKKIIPKFLLKYLHSRIGQLYLEKLQHIASQPNINLDEILTINVIMPEKNEQKTILSNLKTIEDEIEDLSIKITQNLKKMNNVLLDGLGINLPPDVDISYYFDELDYDDRLSFGMHHPNNKALQNALKKAKYKPRPLDDFITLSDNSIDTKTNPDSIFTYIGLENIEQNTGKLIEVEKLLGREILSKSKIFKKGQLMFSGLRPYLNKAFILTDYDSAIGSLELFICNAKNNVSLEFLKYYLLSELTLRQTKWILSGSSYPRLDDNDFINLQIVIPEDVKEQTKILEEVKKLDNEIEYLKNTIKEKKNEMKIKFEKMLLN